MASSAAVGRSGVAARARAVPAWAWVGALVLVSTLFWYGLARRVVAPWIMADELIYSELAKSFAAMFQFAHREGDAGWYGPVYPILISPAWAIWESVVTAWTAVKAFNSLVMSLAAIPVYLLARRVVSTRLALVAALLAVAVPSMVYTGTVMTEPVYYPLFLLVAYVLVRVLEEPTRWNQVALIGVCGLAFLTRVQTIAVFAGVVTAPLLLVWIRRTGRRGLAPFRVLYAIVGAGALAAVAALLVRGPEAVLGVYDAAFDTEYEVSTALRWLVYHVAHLDLYVGVAPFAAFLVLAGTARRLPAPVQAFVAASVALIAWMTLLVAVFASSPAVSRIEERNLFYVVPLLVIALHVWIELGLPRPRAAAVAALVSAALVGAIPYESLINVSASSDTLLLLPWWTLQDTVLTLDQVGAVAVLCAIVLGAAFLLVPQRWALALPAFVLAYFVAATWTVETNSHGGFQKSSIGALYAGITLPDREWVDHALPDGAEAAYIWTGNADRFTLWANEFFSRKVGTVYGIDQTAPGGMPWMLATVDEDDGAVRTAEGEVVREQYVLTDLTLRLRGPVVARDRNKGLAIVETGGEVRLRELLRGIDLDNWVRRRATYRRYDCAGGRLTVTAQADPTLFRGRAQTVTATTGPQRIVARVADERRLRIPLHPRNGVCDVAFTPAFTAVPAAVLGTDDTRELGVRLEDFRYTP